MNSIDRLSEMFAKFPGIGPKQARRFVYFLLSRNAAYTQELLQTIQNLKKEITQCESCMRFYARAESPIAMCSICSDNTRDASMLMVVPRDIDLESVERSGSFKGQYFVLGGVVPILEKEPEKRIRLNELERKIKSTPTLKEVILAMNANNEGENTADFLREKLPACRQAGPQDEPLTISILGRGLSTGTELEYADPETLKNAFLHRTK